MYHSCAKLICKMTLTTHVAIAAAVTNPLMHTHPALIFIVAAASHYVSDAIPHWDYPLHSIAHESGYKSESRFNWHSNTLLTDLNHMIFDGVLAIGILFFFMRPEVLRDWLMFGAIAIGSTLPDFLQGVYFTKKAAFLKPLQLFHDRMHTKIKLGPYPLIGIPFQLTILFLSLWLLK
ncbi:MAG: hypothetical protein G01um101466_12 [Parcubacteria group bacterium Gr01-1014_66]|nr:MAG: hypothetical protein G01um101466_12 [Parcubacteria group bacterium Gr01-1014_66]